MLYGFELMHLGIGHIIGFWTLPLEYCTRSWDIGAAVGRIPVCVSVCVRVCARRESPDHSLAHVWTQGENVCTRLWYMYIQRAHFQFVGGVWLRALVEASLFLSRWALHTKSNILCANPRSKWGVTLNGDISSLRALGPEGGQISRVVHVSTRADFGVFAEKYGFAQEGHTFIGKVWLRARWAHISWKVRFQTWANNQIPAIPASADRSEAWNYIEYT